MSRIWDLIQQVKYKKNKSNNQDKKNEEENKEQNQYSLELALSSSIEKNSFFQKFHPVHQPESIKEDYLTVNTWYWLIGEGGWSRGWNRYRANDKGHLVINLGQRDLD